MRIKSHEFLFTALAVVIVSAVVIMRGNTGAEATSTLPTTDIKTVAPPLTTASAPEAPSVGGVPAILIDYLRNSESYEDFMARTTRALRQVANGTEQITAEQVQTMELAQKAGQRASIIQAAMRFDLNADGRVTREEIDKGTLRENRRGQNQMQQWDSNSDGVVEFEELLKMPIDERRFGGMRQEQQRLMELDPNKDGVLTIIELKTVADDAFKRVDTDHNGLLSDAERNFLSMRQREIREMERVLPQAKLEIPADAELYVVGVYEGSTRSGATGREEQMVQMRAFMDKARLISDPQAKAAVMKEFAEVQRGNKGTVHGPIVDIAINRPGKKVVLLLISHEQVRWRINSSDNFAGIYLSNPKSEVLMNGQPVPTKTTRMPLVYKKEGKDFRNLLTFIKLATGRDKIDGFVGSYSAPELGFSISEPSNDVELKEARLVVADPTSLPKATFVASLNGKPGEYDLTGKLVKPLAAHQAESVYVPSQKRYYSIGNDGLKVQDEQGAKLASVDISLDVPPLSHPTGLALDTKRERIILSSLGGEGFLYAYDIAAKKWSVLSSLNQTDLGRLSYDAQRDRIVSAIGLGGTGIALYDANGQPVQGAKPIAVGDFPGFKDTYDPGNGHANYSVQVSGKYYVVLVGGSGYPLSGGSSNPSRVYLLDPDTGEAKLTYASPL